KMKKLLAVIATAFAFSTSVVAQEKALDDPSGAIAFIQGVSDDTVVAWSDSKLTKAERAAAFRSIFREATDINLLARGMLGRHYRTISTEERKSYMAAMRDYIVAEFDKRMEQVGFKTLEVYGTRPASGRRGHIFVLTKIKRESGEPILADWRVRKKKGAFQIVNLDFEGINLMITNRDLFSAKIKSGGISGLIEWLKRQSNTSKG
ncbi:MAG: ABC transporter substrate-binding protein, partial [Kordiimonadaceae bacterium]|nr:ABC transporter substrate-binding protein [Kordiimonadaceae bacterium]